MNEKILELCHHGIDKQRWGVRNGPPYPLDSKTHSRVVSGKQDKILKKYDASETGITMYTPYQKVDSYGSAYGSLLSPLKAQKQYAVSAYNKREGDYSLSLSKYLTSDKLSELKTLSGHGKISTDDYTRSNPFFNEQNDSNVWLGGRNNCVKCSNTLALRAKGYDVVAGLAPNGMRASATQAYWDGARAYKEKGSNNLAQRMRSFGNKGMGEFIMRYASGSGHSMFFQNEKQGDGRYEPVIYDGQTGKKLGSVVDAIDKLGFDTSQFGQITRLDDATPNMEKMIEDSVFMPREGKFGFSGTSKNLYDSSKW